MKINPHSDEWLLLSAWAEERIEALRLRNDDATLTEIETAVIRGNIEVLKQMLELGVKEAPIIRGVTPQYY